MRAAKTRVMGAGHGPSTLESVRGSIDRLDSEIVELLARRMGLSRAAREVKRGSGLPAVDLRREAEIVRRAAHCAQERGLEPELVRDIFWRVLELSRAVEPGEAST